MLSFVAICILSVSGHSRSHSHFGSHGHHNHDMHQYHQHAHEHHASHSSDNHKHLHKEHHDLRDKSKRKPYHKCSDDHHKIKKGENLHEFYLPYDNHPYYKPPVKIMDNFDEVPADVKDIMDPIFRTPQPHQEVLQEPRSLLTDNDADPIRISVYYDDSSINSLSSSNQAHLKKTISAAINYYQNFVQVIPVSGTWFFDRCSTWWTTNGYRRCASYQTNAYCQSSPVPSDHYGDLKLYSSSTQSYSIIPGGDGMLIIY